MDLSAETWLDPAETTPDPEKQKKKVQPIDSLKANILVMHSTLQSTHSFVDRINGSLFIQPLLEELKNHATVKHLLEILTTVTAKVEINHPPLFLPLNAKGLNMKVKYEDQERSIKLVGKNGDIDNIPLCTRINEKTVHVPHTLEHYWFSGEVTDRRNNKKQGFESTDGSILTQYNQTGFEIAGKIQSKVNEESARMGTVVIDNNQPKVNGELVSHTRDDTQFEILASVEGIDDLMSPEILEGKEVTCSYRGQKFTLTKKDDQWGVESVVAQLPFITSTLLKKLYIVKVGL